MNRDETLNTQNEATRADRRCYRCKSQPREVDGLCEECWDLREFDRENASELGERLFQ